MNQRGIKVNRGSAVAVHVASRRWLTFMKFTHSLLLALIYSAVQSFGADSLIVEPGIASSYDVRSLPVLKVFSAKDGDHQFVAYLVKWKESEVVVSDPLAQSRYKVGDQIPVLVIKTSLDKKDGNKIHELSFTLGRPDGKK